MKELINPNGYLEQLRLNREAAQARRAAIPKPPTLEERIESWYDTLSDEDKVRPYQMIEFRQIFGESPQKLGASLFELGWKRSRLWRDNAPTARYWLKGED